MALLNESREWLLREFFLPSGAVFANILGIARATLAPDLWHALIQ